MDENLIDCVAEAMRAQAEYKTGDDYFLRVVGDKKKPLWKELAKTAIEAIKRIADESNKQSLPKTEWDYVDQCLKPIQNLAPKEIIAKPGCEHSSQQPGQPCPDCIRFNNTLWRS